jgi:translation initiation factor 2B subunit (eIF-2B alpha/beta/delta family)
MLGRTNILTEAAITRIASDNVSGAAEILRSAATVFSLMSAEPAHQASPSIEEAQRAILNTGLALARAQPDMSSLLRLASEALSAAHTETAGRQALRAAADAALRFVESATDSAHRAAMHAVLLIRDGSKVLTHSRSSTVLEALIKAQDAGKHFEVVATESGPMVEGRKLASELSDRGINVTVIADAAASLFIERADLIMIGADKITPRFVVNKVGTRMIALAARERGVPIYVICDTSKFIADDYLAGVAVPGSYFEATPLGYFTGIIGESGVLSNVDAAVFAGEARVDPMLIDALRELPGQIR